MNKASRAGAAIAVICGLELVVVAVIGGAGLAALLQPSYLAIAAMVVVLAAGLLVHRGRQLSPGSHPDTWQDPPPAPADGRTNEHVVEERS